MGLDAYVIEHETKTKYGRYNGKELLHFRRNPTITHWLSRSAVDDRPFDPDHQSEGWVSHETLRALKTLCQQALTTWDTTLIETATDCPCDYWQSIWEVNEDVKKVEVDEGKFYYFYESW